MKLLPLAAALSALVFSLGATSAAAQTKKGKAPAEAGPPQASAEQLDALGKADVGDFTCEFNQKVSVKAHPKHAGYALLSHGKQSYVMRPVVSHTGAIRLEDMRGQTLMVQIATKSMLMDTKAGRRLADGCLRAGDEARAQPPAGEGLGINAKAGG